jgi:hypothetical protein
MSDTLTQHQALMRHVATVREFRETESIKHVVALLQLTRASLLDDLADVAPDRLQFTQGALKQTDALLKSITGLDGFVHPKV